MRSSRPVAGSAKNDGTPKLPAGRSPRGEKGSGAPASAKSYGFRDSFESRRALDGAPHALLLGALPRFALLERDSLRPSGQGVTGEEAGPAAVWTSANERVLGMRRAAPCAQVARSAVAQQTSTASSWQGLLVVPGGAPPPPECPGSRMPRPAGAAPRPTITTPRESAPSMDEVAVSVSEILGTGIRCG